MPNDIILELKGITKIFPGVKALDNVHFQLRQGEIHALMGENGAGKSTFIKVITGVYIAEHGEITLYGNKVNFKGPKDALNNGIAAVYQHPTTYPELSVAENIYMGHEFISGGIIQWKEMNKSAKTLLDRLDANVKPTDEMGALSIAQQQMVEIAKALSTNAKIIILDEPTAALTKNESEKLYNIVEQLRDEGVSFIFISHRMEDMYRLADRVTVFRDAKYIGTYGVKDITGTELISAMVGREISDMFPKSEAEIGEELFKMENFSKMGYFKDVCINVRKGEIVGLTGLVGAGRTETIEAMYGITSCDSGDVYVDGKKITIKKTSDAMDAGIVLIPEDRQKQGLILNWGLGDNVALPIQDKLAKGPFKIRNIEKEHLLSKKKLEEVDTKAISIYDLGSTLSGGNQQKVVVAKALAQSNMKVLIMDEPTKGVDVGAKAEIYTIMGELAKEGYGILMISSEMSEIIGMCDRIFVMCKGRITGCLTKKEVTQEKILGFSMEQSQVKNKGVAEVG